MKQTLLLLLILLPSTLSQSQTPCSAEESSSFPNLCNLISFALKNPGETAKHLRTIPIAAIVRENEYVKYEHMFEHEGEGKEGIPIVTAHGMGDSCFNKGMRQLTRSAGQRTNSYATCIPTGDTLISDTINGFLMDMDTSVDVFAAKVKADKNLKNGFNAFGLSQGNNIIRGYIARYNDPPVQTFMSICGINAGVGGFPNCDPTEHKFCKVLSEILGGGAYNSFVQGRLFQADYFRDTKRTDSHDYKKYSQLAQWGNEGLTTNPSLNLNYAKTQRFVWVLASLDTVVWPREGEWWGTMDPSKPYDSNAVLAMNETSWYVEDKFGLGTADGLGKNVFEAFVGGHIQFTETELMGWLDKYFK